MTGKEEFNRTGVPPTEGCDIKEGASWCSYRDMCLGPDDGILFPNANVSDFSNNPKAFTHSPPWRPKFISGEAFA